MNQTMYLRLIRSLYSHNLIERLEKPKLIEKYMIKRCSSSSPQSRKPPIDEEPEESFGGPSKQYLRETEQPHFKKSKRKKSNQSNRLRQQKTRWLGDKVDEIRRKNEHKEENEVNVKELKTQYNFTEENQFEIMNTELIPLYLIDYEKQVKIKKRRLELYLKQFLESIKTYSSTVIVDPDGNPCVINDPIRSDLLNEYRSQDEFHIGLSVTKSITVGSMFGNFNAGSLTCVPPDKFIVCKKSHRLLAKKFEHYLKEKSRLNVCLDYKSEHGNWITFFVRSNQDGEHQCLAKLNRQKLTEDDLNAERKLLIDYFQSITDEVSIRSLSLEILKINRNFETGEKASGETSVEHLFGDPNLPVEWKNDVYKISVKSLFPLNVGAYAKTIDFIIDNLDLRSKQNVIFLNPYGGFGLVQIARPVDTLFVLNKTEQHMQDTKKSIEHFDKKLTKKIQFRSGNMVKNLFKVLDSNAMEMSVIIKQEDLNFQMLNELRENPNVSQIVIISTKPQAALLKFWTHLCLDNKNNISDGNPFNFISATPVDSHPHSNIYTIISIFERIVS